MVDSSRENRMKAPARPYQAKKGAKSTNSTLVDDPIGRTDSLLPSCSVRPVENANVIRSLRPLCRATLLLTSMWRSVTHAGSLYHFFFAHLLT